MGSANKHIEVELVLPKGAAQMNDPYGRFNIPGLAHFSLNAGFGDSDYLHLRGTAKAVRAAGEAADLEPSYVNAQIQEALS